jgi:hypothetical protein
MPDTPDDELRELKEAVMRADLALKLKQAKWETPKALAAFLAGVAVFGGLALGIANLLSARPPQTITVHLDAPLILQPTAPH